MKSYNQGDTFKTGVKLLLTSLAFIILTWEHKETLEGKVNLILLKFYNY